MKRGIVVPSRYMVMDVVPKGGSMVFDIAGTVVCRPGGDVVDDLLTVVYDEEVEVDGFVVDIAIMEERDGTL